MQVDSVCNILMLTFNSFHSERCFVSAAIVVLVRVFGRQWKVTNDTFSRIWYKFTDHETLLRRPIVYTLKFCESNFNQESLPFPSLLLFSLKPMVVIKNVCVIRVFVDA